MWLYVLAALLLAAIWAGWYFFHLALAIPLWIPIVASVVVVAFVVAVIVIRRMRALRAAKALEKEIMKQAEQQAANTRPDRRAEIIELQEQMQRGIASLKASKLGNQTGAAAMYALPWYMIVGPPGAGKTTALKASGLEFPFLDPRGGGLRGVGGTRNCDWWFSNEGIILDTAGRFATEADDHDEWIAFLGMLRKFRTKKPINGMIVAISISDLAQATEEQVDGYASKLRSRIDEVMTRLEMVVPVYVTFTKCDLIAGFTEFFGDLRKSERGQMFGATIPLDRPDTFDPGVEFEVEFDTLVETLHARTIKRIGNERQEDAKTKIFQFPLEFQSLRANLGLFVSTLFQKSAYAETPIFRGFYFTSGTQEGRPMDRVLGSMARAFGLRTMAGQQTEEKKESKSYFLTDVFRKVAFPDQDVAARTARELRRVRVQRLVIAGAAAFIGLMLIVPSLVTFFRNQSYVKETRRIADEAMAVDWSDSKKSAVDKVGQLDDIQARLADIAKMRKDGPPLAMQWGMYSADDLYDPLGDVYLAALRKGLREPTLKYLKSQLDKWSKTDFHQKPEDYVEAFNDLELYLMLTDTYADKLDVPDAESGECKTIDRNGDEQKATACFASPSYDADGTLIPGMLTDSWAAALGVPEPPQPKGYGTSSCVEPIAADFKDYCTYQATVKKMQRHAGEYLRQFTGKDRTKEKRPPRDFWATNPDADPTVAAVRDRLNAAEDIRDYAAITTVKNEGVSRGDVFREKDSQLPGFGHYVESKALKATNTPPAGAYVAGAFDPVKGIMVPGQYTFEGWCVVNARIESRKNGTNQVSWVLGPAKSSAKDQVDIAKLEKSYYENYIKAWEDFLGDLDVHEPENNEIALAELTALNDRSPELPYEKLLQTVADNTTLDDAKCKPVEKSALDQAKSAAGNAKAKLNQVAGAASGYGINVNVPGVPTTPAGMPTTVPGMMTGVQLKLHTAHSPDPETHFKPLVAFGVAAAPTGKDQSPAPTGLSTYHASVVTKLIGLLNDIKEGKGTPSDPNQATTEYQGAYRTTVEMLSGLDVDARKDMTPLLMNPIELTWKALMKDTGGAASGGWYVQVYKKWAKNIDKHYPFDPNSQIDTKLDDYTEFFKPKDGLVWGFYEANLKNFLTEDSGDATKPGMFTPTKRFGSSIPFTPVFLKCLSRTSEITKGTFVTGSAPPPSTNPDDKTPPPQPGAPVVQFEINLHSVSENVSSVDFEVDGVGHEYKNEPEEWVLLQWPAKEPKTHGATLRVRGYGGLDEEISRMGDFGFFRLLDAAEITTAPAKGNEQPSLIAEWQLRSESAVVRMNLRPLKTDNPFNKNFWHPYKCPPHITAGGK